MNSFKYTINQASEEEIYSHLNACKNLFKPSLDTYVNLFEYANKIKINAFTFEAWIDNRLCGLVACYLNDKEKLNGHITNVSVLKEEQGKGIAKTLLTNAIRESEKKGFKTITLDVEDNNANAIKFYQKLNFTLSTKVANKYSMINRIKEDQNAMVSICCITYNHEKFIREALDGFLMQETNFPIEVLIHDDASTDDTANIIREYEKKYPEIIKPIYQTENQYSKGVGISVTYNFPRAKGKYIAMCEGDDYWTDPLKLQKQVDFLEANAEYSGAAHQSQVIYENSTQTPNLFRNNIPSTIELEDLLESRLFHTASFIFRTELIKKYPFANNITAGDRALFLMVASFGKINFSNDIMCCYRKNEGGISTWITSKLMEKDLNMVPWLKSINPKFPKHRYYAFIHHTILTYPKYISKQTAIKHSFWQIFHSFYKFPKNIKPTIIYILYEFPKIWKKTQKHILKK